MIIGEHPENACANWLTDRVEDRRFLGQRRPLH